MRDWRQISNQSRERVSQVSVRGSGEGMIIAQLDTASGENQSAKLVYSGGEKSIALPMPFESSNSWIRSIPESATTCVVGFRADTSEPTFVNYVNENPKAKLDAYAAGLNAYRYLVPGEHEIASSGLASIYLSARPALEMRGGLIRSWLDQDRLESGQKAPLHTRQIWDHDSSRIIDEERFGVVRRPLIFATSNPAASGLAAGELAVNPAVVLQLPELEVSPDNLPTFLTSYNFHKYPFPDFTIPAGPAGVPAFTNIAQEAADIAIEVAAGLLGKFKKRLYAKESLKVIKNPLFPFVPSAKLIDFREGQVFNDQGIQEISFASGAYIRARYRYFTPLPSPLDFFDAPASYSEMEVDELGNVSWLLSAAAINGYSVTVPFGKFSVIAAIDSSFVCGKSFDVLAGVNAGITTTTSISLLSGTDTGITCGTSFDVTTLLGGASMTSATNISSTAIADIGFTSATFTAQAAASMVLNAPLINVGAAPAQPMVMGTSLVAFLNTFIETLTTFAPIFCIGNLGNPAPMHPGLIAALKALQTAFTTDPITSPLTSKTINLGP